MTNRDIDYVEFQIFSIDILKNIDQNINYDDLLSNLFTDINIFLYQNTKDFIWERGPCSLSIVQEKNLSHIKGLLYFDNSLDDEYLILRILLDYSKINHTILIKIWDQSCDFILADTSDILEQWVTTDSSVNRVLINCGFINLVPPNSEFPLTATVDLCSSLIWVHNHCQENIRQPVVVLINQIINDRLMKFTKMPFPNIHSCKLFIPSSLATFLLQFPQSCSLAIHSFIERDICNNAKISNPRNFDPESRVLAKVRMTRNLYAQLSSVKFFPSKKSKWINSDVVLSSEASFILGFKLTCGFELLLNEYSSTLYIPTQPNIFDSKLWKSFNQLLIEQGYFKNLLEGSKLYNQLLIEAKNHFKTQIWQNDIVDKAEASEYSRNITIQLKHHLEKNPSNCSCDDPCIFGSNLPDDDLDWFHCNPQKLDEIIAKKLQSNDNIDMRFVNTNLNSFIDYKSSVEGVEFDNCDLNKDINVDPSSIESALNQFINDFDDIYVKTKDNPSDSDSISDEEEIPEEFNVIMKDIGDMLNKVDESPNNQNGDVNNLINSVLSQPQMDGPAFNIFSQIGFSFDGSNH